MKKPFVMDVRVPSKGALDFSYLLDAPAGKHGFLRAANGRFQFEDGSGVRFFGVNLSGGGIMPDRDIAVIYAERLAKSGVNMVRLHYGDGPNSHDTSLIDYSKGNSRSLNPENLDRHDFFISELKKRGIYIHIDLFVARVFQPGDDLDYNDMHETPEPLKQLNIVNRRLIELQKEYAQLYLTHINPYTGLRYVDDPAVAIIEIMNENSIFWYHEKLCSTGSVPISHGKLMDRLWHQWLLEKYGSREALDEAWTNEYGEKSLENEEDPEASIVYRPEPGRTTQPYTDYRRAYRGVNSPARYADHIEFLSGLELRFCKEMRECLLSLGVKCMINVSNHARGPADTYTTALYEDVVEGNTYFNHPVGSYRVPEARFHDKEMYCLDPRKAEFLDHNFFHMNLITALSQTSVEGKPFMSTEWSSLYPTRFNSEAMLMMAAYGSLQDWGGMLLYSYCHSRNLDGKNTKMINGFFDIFNDPATWGQVGICSAIFQEGMVRTARNSVELCYTFNDMKAMTENWLAPFGAIPYISKIRCRFIDDRYEGDADLAIASGFTPTGDYTGAKHALVYSRSPYKDAYQRARGKDEYLNRHMQEDAEGFMGIGRIGKERAVILKEEGIDSDYRAYSEIVDYVMKKWGLIDPEQGLRQRGTFISDTGEIAFNFFDGGFTVDAGKVSAYAGNVAGEVKLGRFCFRIGNKKMSISALSRDGRDIDESRHILITALGESGNTDMKWHGRRLIDAGREPVWVDQLEGILELEGCFDSCKAYALAPDGERGEELPVKAEGGKTSIALDSKQGTIYYEIII